MNTEKMFEIQKHNKKLISNLNSFSLIDKEAKKIIKKNQQFFRFLILFHDIGKIQQNADHEKLSANLIDKYINGDFFRLIIKRHIYSLLKTTRCLVPYLLEKVVFTGYMLLKMKSNKTKSTKAFFIIY